MTNFEYYKEQILECINEGRDFCVDMYGGGIRMCDNTCGYSKGCMFSHGNNIRDLGNCTTRKLKWLYEEHIEQPKLTKKERAFLEICNPECYIARDNGGTIYLYEIKPDRSVHKWSCNSGSCINLTHYNNNNFMLNISDLGDIFPFITWEEDEPWSVEDLLKLEVE